MDNFFFLEYLGDMLNIVVVVVQVLWGLWLQVLWFQVLLLSG